MTAPVSLVPNLTETFTSASTREIPAELQFQLDQITEISRASKESMLEQRAFIESGRSGAIDLPAINR